MEPNSTARAETTPAKSTYRCRGCGGFGYHVCTNCKGSGAIVVHGGVFGHSKKCPACDGNGKFGCIPCKQSGVEAISPETATSAATPDTLPQITFKELVRLVAEAVRQASAKSANQPSAEAPASDRPARRSQRQQPSPSSKERVQMVRDYETILGLRTSTALYLVNKGVSLATFLKMSNEEVLHLFESDADEGEAEEVFDRLREYRQRELAPREQNEP